MQRAVLLYNPAAGGARNRTETLKRVASFLSKRSVDVTITATLGPGTAGIQAAEAAAFADTVVACGGDGTVHEVLQGLAQHPTATLGILPMGSANVLARHLKLSPDPVRAAEQQLQRIPTLVPLGHVRFTCAEGERSRYFTVLAGAGPDGALTYKMLAGGKQRFGRLAYYVRAASLYTRNRFASFDLTYQKERGTTPASMLAISAMAVRVSDLGGLFSPLVLGASLEHPHLSLTAVLPPSRWSLPAWFAMSWARLHRWNPVVRSLAVTEFSCGEGIGEPVQVQADGEWLGRTPMRVTLVPNALRLLLPPAPTSR